MILSVAMKTIENSDYKTVQKLRLFGLQQVTTKRPFNCECVNVEKNPNITAFVGTV